MERAEDRVGLALLGGDLGEVVDGVQPGMRARLHAGLLERPPDAGHPSPGEGAGVGGEVDLAGVGLLRKLDQLPLRRPVADDQVPLEALTQLGQALEHELGARARGVAAAEQTIVEAEDADHALAAIEGRSQRGMVVQAQVAREPENARHRQGYGAG